MFNKILETLKSNKEWIFSGIGTATITHILTILMPLLLFIIGGFLGLERINKSQVESGITIEPNIDKEYNLEKLEEDCGKNIINLGKTEIFCQKEDIYISLTRMYPPLTASDPGGTIKVSSHSSKHLEKRVTLGDSFRLELSQESQYIYIIKVLSLNFAYGEKKGNRVLEIKVLKFHK